MSEQEPTAPDPAERPGDDSTRGVPESGHAVPSVPAESAAPIELRYTLTTMDLVEFYMLAWQEDPRTRRLSIAKRRRFRASLAMAVLFVIAAVVLLAGAIGTFGDPHTESYPVLAIGCAACAAGACWTAWQYRPSSMPPENVMSHARSIASSEHAQGWTGLHRMRISPEGLHRSSRHYDIVQRWSGIAEIRVLSRFLYVRQLDGGAYIVPERAFATPQQAEECARQAREWLQNAGHGDLLRIRSHLADRDCPCPNCGYNLRGLKEPMCPECNEEILFADVMNATSSATSSASAPGPA